jgi:hypothetical protein
LSGLQVQGAIEISFGSSRIGSDDQGNWFMDRPSGGNR